MEVGDGSNVPRIAGHGTRDKGAFIVNEVGDNHFYELLWELGDWARACGRGLWGGSIEQPPDFGYGPVPNLVDEQLARYQTARMLNETAGDDLQKHLLRRTWCLHHRHCGHGELIVAGPAGCRADCPCNCVQSTPFGKLPHAPSASKRF